MLLETHTRSSDTATQHSIHSSEARSSPLSPSSRPASLTLCLCLLGNLVIYPTCPPVFNSSISLLFLLLLPLPLRPPHPPTYSPFVSPAMMFNSYSLPSSRPYLLSFWDSSSLLFSSCPLTSFLCFASFPLFSCFVSFHLLSCHLLSPFSHSSFLLPHFLSSNLI